MLEVTFSKAKTENGPLAFTPWRWPEEGEEEKCVTAEQIRCFSSIFTSDSLIHLGFNRQGYESTERKGRGRSLRTLESKKPNGRGDCCIEKGVG